MLNFGKEYIEDIVCNTQYPNSGVVVGGICKVLIRNCAYTGINIKLSLIAYPGFAVL